MANETYKTLIEAVIDDQLKTQTSQDRSSAFERVVNTLLMDSYDLSIDEIEDGDTDGAGDGQVDAMYVLVNGAVLTGEVDQEIPTKGPLEIAIFLVQSKNVTSFEENPLKILRATVRDLIDLTKSYSSPVDGYSDHLQQKFALARRTLMASAGRTASISVRVFYATKGSTDNIHPNVKTTAQTLESELVGLTATTDVKLNFVGAEEVIGLSRQPRTRTRELEADQLMSSTDGDSFVGLVKIGSLVSLLSDDNGELIRGLFDANVRDFLGRTEVNDAMHATLTKIQDEDFWWFNNGVTIIASKVDQKGRKLVLTDALVVNGLQTSNVLYNFMHSNSVAAETKAARAEKIVLVKIIAPPNEEIRDQIITATNSQTHIPKPYLRGMDTVHRNIEDHLKSFGLHYERRKNQYRNAGKARINIVTLAEAAQAVMAAFLFRGSDARARPNSLLKSDDDYKSLFSESYPLDSYKAVVFAKRAITQRLISSYPNEGAGFRNDVIYHVLAFLGRRHFYSYQHAATGWKDLTLDNDAIAAAVLKVADLYKAQGGTERVAKSPEFNQQVAAMATAERVAAEQSV